MSNDICNKLIDAKKDELDGIKFYSKIMNEMPHDSEHIETLGKIIGQETEHLGEVNKMIFEMKCHQKRLSDY